MSLTLNNLNNCKPRSILPPSLHHRLCLKLLRSMRVTMRPMLQVLQARPACSEKQSVEIKRPRFTIKIWRKREQTLHALFTRAIRWTSSYYVRNTPAQTVIRAYCARAALSFDHARTTIFFDMFKIWPRVPRSRWLHCARSRSLYDHGRSNCDPTAFNTFSTRSASVVGA